MLALSTRRSFHQISKLTSRTSARTNDLFLIISRMTSARCAVPGADTTDRFYFPICGDARQFEGDVAKSYPGLKAVSPDLWGFLESIQPYHSEWSWLGAFNKLNNENKHGRLVAGASGKRRRRSQHHAMEVVSSAGCRIKFGSARAFASMASQSIPGPKCPCQTLR